ncbi:xanthine dehydrogenase family protein molybdopterin-binding subunit [Variovorax paradoxus]|jgi:isoquinoline 1-oxidoreductase beta subunit|uniref:xanthine dehydrogenase family protein molybdopterin-binding subunit n=1 Tax=Variovorax paradoxus TaxID=34073 RepID=UPI0029C8D2D2|nr:molybdopterin cofactor-binding domain-containing protein [Variovorax paradoxus]WPH23829.1 molybdopterin cofactor-binding domain-containing protein [Variovorax paradoxus]
MANIARIARRTFLIGTGAMAAGLAVGTYLYKRDLVNPLLRDLPDGTATLNPYVRIDARGITLITPRADLGQGAYSVQAALIAEELDVAWGQFEVEPGPPSPTYYNGTVMAEAFPIAATSDTFMARSGRGAAEAMGKLMGIQVTGGSTTVPDAFDRLRVAGAVARQMLLAAAAQQTGVPLAELKTAEGHVITPDGKRLPYTSLAAVAGKLTPPTDVTLKPASQWRLLGKPMQRLDIPAKSTGTAMYGIDLRMPGMVYATVRTNPRRGGGVKSFDARKAEAAKGVLKIVPIAGGVGVIANNTWRAFQAANLLEVEWGAAPYPATTDAMFQQAADSFTDERRDSRQKDEGDVESVLKAAQANQVVQAEYRVPYLAHAPLEPMNAVVLLKGGRLDIWTGTQIPRFVVAGAAAVSGLAEENVHLHVQIMGGSFGRRLEDDYVRQAVELAKAHPGVPIKMTWSREEDMTHDFPRPLAIARARGIAAKGQVQAYDLAIAAQSVNTSQLGRQNLPTPGPDMAIVAGAWDQPFAIPHYRVTGYRVPEMVPVSSWRSVGASGNGFLHECFLDELILAAGADPLAERLRLCSHEPSRRVLQAVGELAGWGTPLPKGRGRGLAFTLSFGVPVAEVVEVTATAKGIRIDKAFVVAEVGQVLDPVNLEAQLTGGVIWGLGHAMTGELTYADGAPQQTNFDAYQSPRLYQTPQILTKALQTTGRIKGIGEPGVPPAAPALANAIFAATGQRIRELPLRKHVEFV